MTTPSLSQLIDQAMERHRVTSANALGKVAKEMGLEIVNTTISQLRNGTYTVKQPKRTTLHAISILAGVPYETVQRAAQLPVVGPPFHTEWGAEFDALTRSQRDVVKAVARALLDAGES